MIKHACPISSLARDDVKKPFAGPHLYYGEIVNYQARKILFHQDRERIKSSLDKADLNRAKLKFDQYLNLDPSKN